MLNGIDFLDDTNMEEEDDDVSEEDKHEGNHGTNEATTTEVTLSMSIAAIRQRESRESKKQLTQSYYDRVKDLDMFVAYFKAKEAQKKRIDPYRVVVRAASAHILKTERINLELMTRLEGRIQLKIFLQDWLESQAPQKGRPSPMETILLPDDNGRRSGCLHMTSRAYSLSQEEFPPRETLEEEVQDFVDVKIHLDEDGISALEGHVQFTVDANFENVAKTWWFGIIESTPLLHSTIVEKFGENIIYVKQELAGMQYKRLMVAGVFLDEAKDRITITQTGIAFDERFPFTEGESRADGTQWVIFQHVTDRLTIVRWSTLNHCPVNANDPLSVEETALNMRISLKENESEESILAKI
ncbi:hypothetical protein AC1031_016796 [Aphanomyces cochlioides]|nr:hypothetical protein AC1031_016796 [Aphanomyces cochlioides]